MRERTSKPVGLIVVADEPALFFSSTEAAEGYLEATDVEDGVYPTAWGPNGDVYRLTTDGNSVSIERDLDVPNDAEGLYTFLAALLTRRGISVSDSASLADLLAQCQRYVDDW